MPALTEPNALSARLRADLLTRWSEPHRRHHDVVHLNEVLAAIDRLAAAGLVFDRTAVDLAAWFHDAIYDIGTDDNEDRSAELARTELAGSPHAAEVARLVELTKTHTVDPGDANGAALSDADLSVLGSTPSRYRTYAAAVRAEYAAIPDDVFRPARARVLAALLEGQLFHSAPGRALWEDQARANVSAELAELTS